MSYIGKTPTPAPLTSSDITDGIITTAKIADSSVTTEKIVADTNFRNLIINGSMDIAQRGTSTTGVTTTDGYYACDRWRSQTDTGTWTVSQSTDVPTGQGFVNSFKLDCTSAGTSNADEVMIRSRNEGQNLQYLKYGTSSAESLTLSFWIKSNKTGNYYVALANFNTTQNRVVSFGYSIDNANTWEKKIITIPGDTSQGFDNSNLENFTLFWLFSAASSFTSGGVSNTWIDYSATRFANSNLAGLGGSTADEVYMTGVQLEAGTTASDFEFLPFDVNLQRCQRYYHKWVSEHVYANIAVGIVAGVKNGRGVYQNKVQFRSAPSLSADGNFRIVGDASATGTGSDISVIRNNTYIHYLDFAFSGGSNNTVAYACEMGANNDADAEIEFSAEL